MTHDLCVMENPVLQMQPVRWAPHVYKKLNGVFCVYKPTGISCRKVVEQLKKNLCRDLNALPCYKGEFEEARKNAYSLPHAENKEEKSVILPNQRDNDLSENRLVLGMRYIRDDFDINFLHKLGPHSSGVMLMGIGSMGTDMLGLLSMAKFLRVYHIKCKLGYSTQNSFHDGTFVERISFKHINKAKMDKVCSSVQSGHQRLMFQYAGVDENSEEAFKLASAGMVRPKDTKTPPMIYNIKCIHFEPPDFTLEIHAINEKCWYIANIVHDIGIKLKSAAVCSHIHRLRYGRFKLNHTLLQKEWKIEHIERNMRNLRPLLNPDKILTNLRISERSRSDNFVDNFEQEDKETEDLIQKAMKEQFEDKI